MTDSIDKLYKPVVVEEVPFPQQNPEGLTDQQGKATSQGQQVYSPRTISEAAFPLPKIATELLGAALNTRSKKILAEFEFTQSGALQIGKYSPGSSGDIRISPSGIVARNTTGDTTFSLDGETGDAVFAGTLQAGTLISGRVVVGNNTWIIDGNPDQPQMVLYNRGVPEILIGMKNV